MQTIPLLKGRPVITMREGHWPNRADIQSVQSMYPGAVVRTEAVHLPTFTTFVVTVARK